jgi:hypothetical protein
MHLCTPTAASYTFLSFLSLCIAPPSLCPLLCLPSTSLLIPQPTTLPPPPSNPTASPSPILTTSRLPHLTASAPFYLTHSSPSSLTASSPLSPLYLYCIPYPLPSFIFTASHTLCLLPHFTSLIRCVHPEFPLLHPTASPRPSFPSVPHSHSLSLQKQPVNPTPTSPLLSQHHPTTHVSTLSLSSPYFSSLYIPCLLNPVLRRRKG